MTSVFADSFYFFALLNNTEAAHAKAVAFANSYSGFVVTTGWVLTEVADGLSRPGNREFFLQIHKELLSHPRVQIVPLADELFARGVKRYAERLDKEWTLTDCISFLVMEEMHILEALTGDHHFEQAGFIALLK